MWMYGQSRMSRTLCNEEDTPDTLVRVYGQSCMSRTFYNDGATADTPVRVVDCPITQVPNLLQRCPITQVPNLLQRCPITQVPNLLQRCEHTRHARTCECVPRHACRIPLQRLGHNRHSRVRVYPSHANPIPSATTRTHQARRCACMGAQRWWWSTVLLGLAEARADFKHFSQYLLSGPSCCPSGSRL